MRPRAPRRRPPRDQAESPFNVILEDFLDVVRFARGAAIVDFEGETVDYAGAVDPFELRVAAATFGLVLADLRTCKNLKHADRVAVRLGNAGYMMCVLDESYSLLIVLRSLGTFLVSHRLLAEFKSRILIEAGLPTPARSHWQRVEVEPDEKNVRPRRLRVVASVAEQSRAEDDGWTTVEILGSLVGTAPRERGYRVRLGSGAELTLLREPSRLWFIDERAEAVLRSDIPAKDLFAFRLHPPPPKPR
ncbi:MAG: hypothetical protein JNK04_16970 [Myxococcales bacterium]|nr:hypothetical protein [Myxococcales bacterium]